MLILDPDIGTFHMRPYHAYRGSPSNLKISELQPQKETGKIQRHYLAWVIRQVFNLEQTSQACLIRTKTDDSPVSWAKRCLKVEMLLEIEREL